MAVDDELAMAAQLLLRDRFVLREEDPEGFFLVRRHERALREFFREKLGWTLLMNMRFYKLEKVPAAGAAYLGIEALQGPEDYALLARLREAHGENWTKEYREMAPEALFSALLPELVDWGMAEEREDGLYRLLPALWRLAGGYEEKGEAS